MVHGGFFETVLLKFCSIVSVWLAQVGMPPTRSSSTYIMICCTYVVPVQKFPGGETYIAARPNAARKKYSAIALLTTC